MSHRTAAVAAGLAAALLAPVAPAAAAQAAVCHISYEAYGDTRSFTSKIVITNTGDFILYGWTLKFALPGGQKLINGWAASFKMDGQDVTAESLSYNSEVGKRKSVTVGFYASGSAAAPGPAEFRVNGNVCTTG